MSNVTFSIQLLLPFCLLVFENYHPSQERENCRRPRVGKIGAESIKVATDPGKVNANPEKVVGEPERVAAEPGIVGAAESRKVVVKLPKFGAESEKLKKPHNLQKKM